MSNWKCVKSDNEKYFKIDKIYEINDNDKSIASDNQFILYFNKNYGTVSFYDCYDSISALFIEIKTIPKLCEILGVDVNEDFKVEFDNGSISEFVYCITENGFSYRTSNYKREITPTNIIYSLINGNYKVIKFSRYKFTPDEIVLLKALYSIGYKYLAKDKDGKLTAFKCKPFRNGDIFGSLGNEYIEMETKLFQQIKFEDEPLEIKCVLD